MIPHEVKFKLRSYAPYWPEGVAVLIHHEDKFKVRSYSMYWPEGVAVLIPHEDNFKLRYVKILCTVLASFDPS